MRKTLVNRLFTPTGIDPKAWAKDALRPGPKAFQRHIPDPDQQELTLEAMLDSLLGGLAELRGEYLPPISEDEPDLAPIFWPKLGRHLWTLDTLLQLDSDAVPIQPLLSQSLRPSFDYPDTLQDVTPRLALQITGLRVNEFIRVMDWFAEQGLLPQSRTYRHLHAFLGIQTYGATRDPLLELLAVPNMPEDDYTPRRNSRRSPAQQAALTLTDRANPKGFAATLLDIPPFQVDLGPDLHETFHKAVDLFHRLSVHARATLDKDDPLYGLLTRASSWDLRPLESQVLVTYLTKPWDFHRLWRPHSISEEDYVRIALTRCMAAVKFKAGQGRLHQPISALGIALCSGISPAIFVKASMSQMERTGYAFLESRHILQMVDMIAAMPKARGPAQERRETLIREMTQLARDADRLIDHISPTRMDEARELVEEPEQMPAWGVGELSDLVEEDSFEGESDEEDD